MILLKPFAQFLILLGVTTGFAACSVCETATPPAVAQSQQPLYRVETIFAIRGHDQGLTLEAKGNSSQEASQFIRAQAILLKTDVILDRMIKTITNTDWRSHIYDPRKALKEALVVEPIAGKDQFRLTLTIRERKEAALILNAISEAYIAWLVEMAAQHNSEDMKAFRNGVETAQKNYHEATLAATAFRASHDIPAMIDSQTVAVIALGQIDARLTELILDRTSLQKSVKELADPTYKLPPELQTMVNSDPNVRAIDDRWQSLERDRDTKLRAGSRSDSREILAIQKQIDTTAQHRAILRETLERDAKQLRLRKVLGTMATVDTHIVEIKKKHDEKQAEVRRLDIDLVGYRNLEAAAHATRAALDVAEAQFFTRKAIGNSAPLRVELIQRAVTPAEADYVR